MVLRKSLSLFLLLFLGSVSAYADAEFYGIQMRDESVAKSLVLFDGLLSTDSLSQGHFFDKNVYATASLKEDADQRVIFSVNIFNNSDKVIHADYQLRDYYLVTKDGRKYPLYDPEAQFELDEIPPKTNLTFQPSLGNLVISKKNIKMIVCSFDLGRTSLFLFPSSKKETIEKLVPPPPPIEPPPAEAKAKRKGGLISFLAPKKSPPATAPVISPAASPAPPQAAAQPQRPIVQEEPVQPPPTDHRVAEAIKNFVYVPAQVPVAIVDHAANRVIPAPRTSPPAPLPASTPVVASNSLPRTEAQVLQYNPDYKFITVNAGVKDGLKKNMLIYVMRGGKTIAQARIKQIREAVSAASVIADSVISEVRAGDKISLA